MEGQRNIVIVGMYLLVLLSMHRASQAGATPDTGVARHNNTLYPFRGVRCWLVRLVTV